MLLKHPWSAEKPEAAVETEFQSDSYSKEMENLKLMLIKDGNRMEKNL